MRFVEGQEAVGAKESRRGLGGGGRRRGPAAHDPRREGARVRGRRRRGRGAEPAARRRTSSRSPTGGSASRSRIRRRGRASSTASYQDVKGAPGARRAGRAAAPLLRRDDPREGAADRLGVGRDAADDASEETPIGWVLSRLGPHEEARERVANGPVEVERGAADGRSSASTGARLSRAATRDQPPPSRTIAAKRPAGAVRGVGRGAAAAGAAAARARADARPAAAARRRGSPTARSRCSSAARTATTPSGWSGMRPAAVGAVRRAVRAALHATEIGDAVHRLLERVDLATARRSRRPRRPRARLVPDRDRRRGRARRATRSRLLRLARSPRASPRSEGVRVERPFAFVLDGVLLNGRLDVLWRAGEPTRSCSTTRRTRSTAVSRPRSWRRSTASSASVYALACFRPGPSGSRSSTSSSRRPRRSSRRAFTSADAEARGARARRARSAASARGLPPDAERVRLLGLPGARPGLRGAWARRSSTVSVR